VCKYKNDKIKLKNGFRSTMHYLLCIPLLAFAWMVQKQWQVTLRELFHLSSAESRQKHQTIVAIIVFFTSLPTQVKRAASFM
jgi:anaerobic C4-dicarboxylate transporter